MSDAQIRELKAIRTNYNLPGNVRGAAGMLANGKTTFTAKRYEDLLQAVNLYKRDVGQ